MGVVVGGGGVESVVGDVVAMVGKAIDAVGVELHVRLLEQEVFVVAHGERGVDGSREEERHVVGEADEIVVKLLLLVVDHRHE